MKLEENNYFSLKIDLQKTIVFKTASTWRPFPPQIFFDDIEKVEIDEQK